MKANASCVFTNSQYNRMRTNNMGQPLERTDQKPPILTPEQGEIPGYIGAPSTFVFHGYQPIRREVVLWQGQEVVIYDITRSFGNYPPEGWNKRITNESYGPLQSIGAFRNPYVTLDMFETLNPSLEQESPDIWSQIERDIKESGRYPMGDTGLHIIMPELSDQTQRMFFRMARQNYFNRWGTYPDFVWLPEMAVDTRTLGNLVAEGFKGTILRRDQMIADAPSPAYKVATEHGDCIVVNSDPGLSAVLAFHDPDAPTVMKWLEQAQDDLGFPPIIAVDGETIGHHRPQAVDLLKYLIHYDLPRAISNHTFNPTIDFSNLPTARVIDGSSWSCLCIVNELARGDHANHPEELAFGRWRGADRCSCDLPEDQGMAAEVRRIKRDLDVKLKTGITRVEEILTQQYPQTDDTGMQIWREEFIRWFSEQLPKLARGEAISSDNETTPAYREYFLLLGMLYNGATSCSRFFGDPNSIERAITNNNLVFVADVTGWENIRPN